jgi:ketosteroid isomerase-like protein
MRISELFLIACVAACVACNTATPPVPAPDTTAQDLAAIKTLEDHFVSGFNAKDTKAIMSLYVPDQGLIVFDVSVPRQYTGADAYTKDWDGFWAMFPGPTNFTLSDLDISIGGNIAYSHSIQHASMTDKKGKKMELTVRVTDGYKKINGQWFISHEHVSVPVDLATMKPDLNSK